MSNINPNTPNLGRDPERRVGGTGSGFSIWAWLVVIAIVVIIIGFAVGGGSHKSMAGPANSSNDNGGAAITDVNQLASSKPDQLAGKRVDIPAATVAEVASSGAVLIDANGKQILVVNGPAANTAAANGASGKVETDSGAWKKDHVTTTGQVRDNGAGQLADRGKGKSENGLENAAPLSQEHTSAFKKGDKVTVQGTVEKMPSEHDAMTQLNLSSDEAARASKANVYIRAENIQPAAQ